MKKILKVLGFVVLSIVLIFLCCSSFIHYRFVKTGDVPYLFNISWLTVQTGSMEPVLSPGDVIFIYRAHENNIQDQDIVTYMKKDNTIVTHRVVGMESKNEGKVFTLKGDANNAPDTEPILNHQLRGRYLFHIPQLANIFAFIRSPIILIPLILMYIGFKVFCYAYRKLKEEQSTEQGRETVEN